MKFDSVSYPTSREESSELNDVLKTFTINRGIPGFEAKKLRIDLKFKIRDEKFTDLDLAWESVKNPTPPAPEPAPAPAPAKGKGSAV